MLRARIPKEMVAVGLAVGLALALVEPVGRLLGGGLPWMAGSSFPSIGRQRGHDVHLVPYGIDRGICDRSTLAAGMRDRDPGQVGRVTASLGDVVTPLVGGAVGGRMDMVDQNCVGRVLEFAPDSRRIYWRNPDNGITYAVAPTRTFQDATGAYCREYHTSATSGPQLQQLHGVACRRGDGAWRAGD